MDMASPFKNLRIEKRGLRPISSAKSVSVPDVPSVNFVAMLAALLCLSLSAGSARADVYSWTGAGSGAWNDSADWTGGGGLFPGAADTARINLGLNPAINVNGSQSVGGLDFTNGSGLATSGTVSLNSGALTIGSAATVVAGQTLSGNASIIAPVNVSGGTLAGPLSIHGNVSSTGGTIVPHNDALSANTLTVVGNMTLDSATTLNFNLASPGTVDCGINDLIDITGNLSLDGWLNVNPLTGFGVGTHRLFNYTGNLTGAGLMLGTVPSGMSLTYTIDTLTGGQVNLEVLDGDPWPIWPWPPPTLPEIIDEIYGHYGSGHNQWDLNNDGYVNQLDVTYALTHLGHTNYGDANVDRFTDFSDFQTVLDHWQAPGGWAKGDFNGDGVVDFLDFQILLDYWNPGGWSDASQVPEPATLCLLALAALGILRRNRKPL